MTNKKDMNVQTIWNIRDARGLTTNEKVFLYTIASRGLCKTTRAVLMEDTGLSTGSITKVVRSLKEKGLITAYESSYKTDTGRQQPTQYVLNDAALTEWCSSGELTPSCDEHTPSPRELTPSPRELTPSPRGDKGNMKVTTKETEKVTEKETRAAKPPVEDSKSQTEVVTPSFDLRKEDQPSLTLEENHPPSSDFSKGDAPAATGQDAAAVEKTTAAALREHQQDPDRLIKKALEDYKDHPVSLRLFKARIAQDGKSLQTIKIATMIADRHKEVVHT